MCGIYRVYNEGSVCSGNCAFPKFHLIIILGTGRSRSLVFPPLICPRYLIKVDDNLKVVLLHKPESQPRIGRICGPEERVGVGFKTQIKFTSYCVNLQIGSAGSEVKQMVDVLKSFVFI